MCVISGLKVFLNKPINTIIDSLKSPGFCGVYPGPLFTLHGKKEDSKILEN